MRVKQINNLVIHRRKLITWPSLPEYYVKTLDGRVLEEFNLRSAAIKWCQDNPATVRQPRPRKTIRKRSTQ